MTNSDMLQAINSILSTLDEYDICTRLDLESLRDRLESDIRMETARHAGTASIVRAANRIIKNVAESKRQTIGGAAMQNGRMCVCDGYRAVRFSSRLPLPEVENPAAFLDLDKVIPVEKFTVPVELPSLSEVKNALKISRASWTGKRGNYCPLPWALCDGGIFVNPQYLVDMLEALPGCQAFTVGEKAAVSPLYFTAENGDGVLLPVRSKDGNCMNRPAAAAAC